MKFDMGVFHQTLSRRCEFHEKGRNNNCTLLRDVIQFLPERPTFQFLIPVKFGIAGLHLMPLSRCELRENWRPAKLKGAHEIFAIFSTIFFPRFGKKSGTCLCRMLVGDCQLPETRCGDSRILLQGENEITFMSVP